ncbi:hypothetical protein CSKR_106301 [Clonorchis sinensis]|uniref:Uncharacterized protein n=2 Tax=Clonorchis sinensis TaxID=79923 RepID=A0A8T1LZD4_CLOSI|nr:hypothetical protein CSKR_106301 [Clonorchis sinensis]GAA27434.1 hypothetical protein CLF_108675 [Clonorchis sinensis]
MSDRSHYASYKGGPVNRGDPDDKYMSQLERTSLFPRFIQERLLTDLCKPEWRTWQKCLREHQKSWFAASKCKGVFDLVNQCQNKFVLDPDEVQKLEQEYLDIRSEYRRTGVGRPIMNSQRIREFMREEPT